MKLRSVQVDALSEPARRDFLERMRVHLRRFFPRQCQSMNDAQLNARVCNGVRRAGKYDIVNERDVCKYCDLMFALGENFDADSRYPWAAAILSEERLDPTVKTNRLFKEALRRRQGNPA